MSELEQLMAGPRKRLVLKDPSLVPNKNFFRRADKLLTRYAPQVEDDILPNLDNYPLDENCVWNPNGFIVLPLGSREDVGTLRLHIWPKGHRKGEQTRAIHDHVGDLLSQDLKCTGGEAYSDTIYRLEDIHTVDSEKERKELGLQRIFRASYLSAAEQRLTTDGTCARPVVVEQRTIEAGERHTIETGIFHLDSIPLDQITATLVWVSPAVEGATPQVLFDSSAYPIQTVRNYVTRTDLQIAQSQLMSL